MPPRLTQTRLHILRLTARLGCPTLRELTAELGITKQGLGGHLDRLRQLGLIETSTDRYAPVRLTDAGRELVGDGGFPVVGRIAAGPPIMAEQDIQRTVNRLDELFGLREGDFFLEAEGDSMVGAGIFSGNLVALRATSEVPSGEIAAVLLPGQNEATLKRVFWKGERVELHSENPAYGPLIYPSADVLIQGRYLGHLATRQG